MISIIIVCNGKDTYLIRCLNSICRQQYKNVEIILVGYDGVLDDLKEYNIGLADHLDVACKNATGEYIMFCSASSVLAQNVLGTFINKISETEKCYITKYFIRHNEKNTIQNGVFYSLYAKIFIRKKLLKILEMQESGVEDWGSCLLEYLSENDYEVLEHTYIYETDLEKIYLPVPGAEASEWIKMVSVLPLQEKMNLIHFWMELENDSDVEGKKVILLAKELPYEKEIHDFLIKNYLCNWYRKVLSEQDETCYRILQSYFIELQHNEMLCITIAQECGITKKQLGFLQSLVLEDYLFYFDKWKEESDLSVYMNEIQHMQDQIKAMEKKISSNEQKLRGMEQKLQKQPLLSAEQKVLSAQTLQGPMLADFTIDCYRNGALGAKTVLKSAGAWLKHKMTRG